MADLTIDFEWADPLGARGAELRATWARLSILIDRQPLTRVIDERSRTVRDAVYLPLYPLAEWLAEQWWPLWNEPPSASSSARRSYDQRHCLSHAREGYALPRVSFEPAGGSVLVRWSPEKLPAQRLEFLERGEVWIEADLARARFCSLIQAVASRLEDNGIRDTRLQQDWSAIQDADGDERAFCESAGALGLDPYSLEDSQLSEIERVGNRLPEEIAAEFFRAARPDSNSFASDGQEVLAAISRAETSPAELAPLRDLRRRVAAWDGSGGAPAWQQGYWLAQQLRRQLHLDGAPLQTLETIAAALETSATELSQATGEFASRSTPFAGLVGINAQGSPAFVLRPTAPPSQRFHFCRALFEYLASPIQRAALVSDAQTERQKRNRAFAAEFLAPSSALRDLVQSPTITWEQAEELAAAFGVSTYVVVHQLMNHRIATVEAA